MAACRTCELTGERDAGRAPPWDLIVRYEGWLVLVLRRHAETVAELSDAEAAELGPLVTQVSRAMAEVLGCEKTYVAQFAEAEGHRHVHVHVIPRYPDQPDARRGPRIFGCVGVPDAEAVPEDRMDEIALGLRAVLA